jgi:hypothetical protein
MLMIQHLQREKAATQMEARQSMPRATPTTLQPRCLLPLPSPVARH